MSTRLEELERRLVAARGRHDGIDLVLAATAQGLRDLGLAGTFAWGTGGTWFGVRVQNEAGAGLGGADVDVRQDGTLVAALTTSAAGLAYHYPENAAGTWTATVTLEGYPDGAADLVAGQVVPIVLGSAWYGLYLYDGDTGLPVAGVDVQLYDEGVFWPATTGADGKAVVTTSELRAPLWILPGPVYLGATLNAYVSQAL